MYHKEEWIKRLLELCCGFSEMGMEEKKEQFSELEKVYHDFPLSEQKDIDRLLQSELENQDFIYIHSILVKYFAEQGYEENVIDCIIQTYSNWYQGSMLELQVIRDIQKCYEKKRLLHKKNIEMYNVALGELHYAPIPWEQHNKKKIVIVTEQILSLLHAPTKMVMDFAYVLQERLGYEVLILACPCDGILEEGLWHNWMRVKAVKDFEKLPMLREYKDALFRGYQVSMSAINLKEYHMMFELIHAWNPLFVWCIGVSNPVADLAGKFTTVVAMEVSLCCPVSEGQILIRLGRQEEETEAEYERVITQNGQVQIFMEEKMPVQIEKSEKTYTRKEWGLPEDKFLIAIVGNRLDEEITVEFVRIMQHILDDNKESAFVIIGEVEKVEEYFQEESYKKRIFYLGYCNDLMGVYGIVDLYLNPRRGGGGFSSQMALAAQVPVVTLPYCDVAYHAGADFIVETEQEMENRVRACIQDKSYYVELKKAAAPKGGDATEEKMVHYVETILDKIQHYMELEH